MSSRRVGFTIIELLIVIAIIGIITAILFPVFSKAMEKSRQTKCLSNLRQLGMAMHMYAIDWNGHLPTVRVFEGGEGNPYGNWAGVTIYGGPCDPRKGQIYSYVNNVEVYLCPNRSDIGQRTIPLSYSMNAMLTYKTLSGIAAPARVGLLIHEDGSRIDDGDFNWMRWAGNQEEGMNRPTKVHNGGTCLIYCDLHAKWQSYDAVVQELSNNDWDPKKP